LRQQGLSEGYLKYLTNILDEIGSNADLDNPDQVLSYIANKKVRESYKANLVDYYSHYCDFKGIGFSKPHYHRDHKLPYVPSKEELNLLIGHASPKYALIYSILRDTGLRPIELSNLGREDIDLENGALRIDSAKHGQPRIVKVKTQTLGMLKLYLDKHIEEPLFPDSNVMSNTYGRLRTSLAKKLQNPSLKKIRLYDFRHYYATSLYHDTRDLLLVKERLGHRNIQNTLVYTHLISVDEESNFYSATAHSIAEAQKLIEQGFDYICDVDAVKLFRKRK
jgi:integrase/recombinase XerD